MILSGVVATGLYTIATGQVVEVVTPLPYLLVAAALGTLGALIEYTRESTILKATWAVVAGGTIGTLISDETWSELLFAFFFGGLLVMTMLYVLGTRRSNSSPSTTDT
ncbi:hypothetical protein HTG_15580 [Natrinema mahii]|nr:hypothetical protein HTG_15580 [Natrinema mahii]